MSNTTYLDQLFGDIAVSMQLIAQEQLDRALVVQRCIFSRAKVHMPIGKVLKEMGVLSQEQVDQILDMQKNGAGDQADEGHTDPKSADEQIITLRGLDLTLSEDKLSAHLSPSEETPDGLNPENVKAYLAQHGVAYGIVDDQVLADYLANDPLPDEPFQVASGTSCQPGRPPEVKYHFETDPLCIGTLKSDGSMDWKDRGAIPQVKAGDLLVEKTKAKPGIPGTSVLGKELPPPRIREPQIKCGKGAERSEDGFQVLAKIEGSPKMGPDGRITVSSILPIKGDIGIETGHIDFDGYVESTGGVNSGFTVKGRGLRTAEIQDTTIEITEDLVCLGGIYGSTLKVGGNLKSSHIHNCKVEVLGDLVVEKEIFGSTIETNSRCLIGSGKIVGSHIDAKKGIQAKDIGSEAASPSKITVGIDHKHERDMQTLKEELTELENQKKDLNTLVGELQEKSDALIEDLEPKAKELDDYLAQKHQFEEQLHGIGPNAVAEDDEEGQLMLKEMIEELVEPIKTMGGEVAVLKAQDSKIRLQMTGCQKSLETIDEQTASRKEQIVVLEESAKVDPGLPVVKVSGTVFHKTIIVGPHKEITIPKNMQSVRIAESKTSVSGKKYEMKISGLR